MALPSITFSQDADLDGVATILSHLIGFAFTVTMTDGQAVNGVLQAVDTHNGIEALDLEGEDGHHHLVSLLSVVTVEYV